MVHNEGLPWVSFCIRVWFTTIPCMDSAQRQTLQVACLQFIVHILSLSQKLCSFMEGFLGKHYTERKYMLLLTLTPAQTEL